MSEDTLTQIPMPDDPSRLDLVHLEGISQTYDGGKTWVIKDLDLRIEEREGRGRFIVILGPSGCGKSTLFRYLAGLAKPTSGKVMLREKPATGQDNVGMVFQDYSNFPWLTVLENVMLPMELAWERSGSWFERMTKPLRIFEKRRLRKEWRAKALEMIKMMGLEGKEHLYAKRETLSGGQRQRLAIARSLVLTPDVLLMDEPFGALDVRLRFKSQCILEEVWEKKGFTCIFVTHDPTEAVFLADRIYVMRAGPGQIVEEFDVDGELPFHRDFDTLKDPKFQALVATVHQKMLNFNIEAAVL